MSMERTARVPRFGVALGGTLECATAADRRVFEAIRASAPDGHAFLVYVEPAYVSGSRRRPDVVLVDLSGGRVFVLEVKGHRLDAVAPATTGGEFDVAYGETRRNPFRQVDLGCRELRDAVRDRVGRDPVLAFRDHVVLPFVGRDDFRARFGADTPIARNAWFAEDLPDLTRKLIAGRTGRPPVEAARADCRAVQAVFGDNRALEPFEPRPERSVEAGTLGERIDRRLEVAGAWSEEQSRLASTRWDAPHLVRGVAGSGKTVVLAQNLARRLAADDASLLERERIAAVCYNRALVPLLKGKIAVAYEQRTGRTLAADAVDVIHFDGLLTRLGRSHDLLRYVRPFTPGMNDEKRAAAHLADVTASFEKRPALRAELGYDAIYIDEAQDLLPDNFRLIRELFRDRDVAPKLFLFYDDAQNIFARPRPNWSELGIALVGRSDVMTEGFRSTRPVVEVAMNVLYGTTREDPAAVPTRAFADLSHLAKGGHVVETEGWIETPFAKRKGERPTLTTAASDESQLTAVVDRARALLEDERVRPQDLFVVAPRNDLAASVAAGLKAAGVATRLSKNDPDASLGARGLVTVSTAASAKGYEAAVVLLVGAERFREDAGGRASFYVACTRAMVVLEVFTVGGGGLAGEFRDALAAYDARSDHAAATSPAATPAASATQS